MKQLISIFARNFYFKLNFILTLMIKKIVLSLITVLSFCSLALAQNKQVTVRLPMRRENPISVLRLWQKVHLPVRRPVEMVSLH